MKQIFLISFFSLITMFIYGQNPNDKQAMVPGIYLPDGSKLNEYKKTYEIKGVANPDNETLSRIDMSKYWKSMNLNNRVEVVDDVTGLTLILYSHTEQKALLDFNTLLIVLPKESNGEQNKKGY